MRVISGKYKGKLIKGYDILGTRPTMDRVKESVFGTIQNYIRDSIILDLFAGSGNLGIEALSNGAKECYFVDINKVSIDVIRNNIKDIGIDENCYFLNMDYNKALDYFFNRNIMFNIIFIDPPYKLHVIQGIIDYIISNNLLINNGILVIECMDDYLSFDDNILELIKEKKYGDKKVYIFKKL